MTATLRAAIESERRSEHQKLIASRAGRIKVAHEMRVRGHTVEEIARSVGVSPGTAAMYLWENGGFQRGLPHLDVQAIRGTRPQYRGHAPAREMDLR